MRHQPRRKLILSSYMLSLFVLAFVVSSCKTKKRVVEEREPLRNRTASNLLKHYDESQFDFDWLAMKVDAEFGVNNEFQSFKATIRMRKDSAVWVSIAPIMGIEMIRLMVTTDTLKVLSKIPDNKFYYLGAFHQLNQKLGMELDFEILQDILVGNAIGLDADEGRFRSDIDGESYLLISRYKRKVRRMVGVDDRKLESDSIVVDWSNPRYQRTVRRVDDNEPIIVSRYWLEPDNFKLVKSVFTDVIRQRTIDIRYEKFQNDKEQLYPSKCIFNVSNPDKKVKAQFEITKMNTSKSFEFPFEIPSDYLRRDSL